MDMTTRQCPPSSDAGCPRSEVTCDAAGAASTIRRKRPPAILFEDGEPTLIMKTGSRVDTGSWFGKRRLWLAVCGEWLWVAAEGRRPYVERVGRNELGESTYCHVTGSLLLAPAHGMRARSLPVPPLEGREVLQWIGGKDRTHA